MPFGRDLRVNGGGGEINYGMCENIFQSILIFGQNISVCVCSRQIGPRIIGPRTVGPRRDVGAQLPGLITGLNQECLILEIVPSLPQGPTGPKDNNQT